VSGSNVVFEAQSNGGSQWGVYASLAGTITPVATNLTTVPGGTGGSFTSFGITPSISGSKVAFYGASSGRTGIYQWTQAGGLTRVADTTTSVPGGSGTFSGFSLGGSTIPISLDGGHIAFVGLNAIGQAGVYTDLTGSLTKVIAVGDTLNGKTI